MPQPSGHIPVLLKEAIALLDPQPGQNFIDGTFGGGGHALAILKKTAPSGRVLGLDANQDAVAAAESNYADLIEDGRLVLYHANFSDIEESSFGFGPVSGIILDLGLSSQMLDDPKRGFSFQKNGPLDMRFDQSKGITAGELLQRSAEPDLKKIFQEYGEEKFAARIARTIANARREHPILTTDDLFQCVSKSLPAKFRLKANDTARRIFQAVRIAVNGELDSLKQVLPQALRILSPGGKLAVISFHPLEDRIVKRYFLEKEKGCVCPPNFPKCVCGQTPQLRILTKKPVVPGAEEYASNSRSRSAKLRVSQKL